VVDNNEEFGPLHNGWKDNYVYSQVMFVRNHYDKPGIIHGDQTGLEIFNQFDFKVGARWDDDLVPDVNCMEKLVGWVEDGGYAAAGGMYPGFDGVSPALGDGFSEYVGGDWAKELRTGDSNPRHLQFFRWRGNNALIPRHYLYSSFTFSVPRANLVGGFCTEYSPHSYRADTDFTLRLNEIWGGSKNQKLIVDTSAMATHLFAGGGTRDIVGDEKTKQKLHDLRLFHKRMRTMGINPNF